MPKPIDNKVRCAVCPNVAYDDEDIALYRLHIKSKWHQHNVSGKMMGRPLLTEEEWEAKFGDPDAAKKKAAPPEPPKEKEVLEEKTKNTSEEELANDPTKATICIVFSEFDEKWSRKFYIAKGSTVLQLKEAMIKPGCSQEDLLSFDLRRGPMRVGNLEKIKQDDTYKFEYIGPDEGQKLMDLDKSRY